MSDCLLVIVGAGASYDCLPAAEDDEVEEPSEPKLEQRRAGAFPVVLDESWIPPRSDIALLEQQLTPPPLLAATAAATRTWSEVRPPLTKDLVDGDREFFNEILLDHTKARPVVDAVRRALLLEADTPTTLEQALKAYQERNSRNPNLKSEMEDFKRYLRDVLLDCTWWANTASLTAGVTNYTRLVADCVRWACDKAGRHVCFLSFNYDLLLDQALEDSTDFRIEHRDRYVQDHVSLLKPHGSASWYNQRDGEFQFLTQPLDRPNRQTRVLRPLLALPVVDKVDLLWPIEQAQHYERIGPLVSRVLTIGWRAADRTFRDPLRDKTGKIPFDCVVGPDDDQTIRQALDGTDLPLELFAVWPEGFTAYIEAGGLDALLWA